MRLASLLAYMLCLAGCAIPRAARVDQRMLIPESADRYSIEENQVFLMPLSLGNDPPSFPAELEHVTLVPTTICMDVVISEAGSVTQALPLQGLDRCGVGDTAAVPVLQRAVRSALAQWRFEPATLCTFPDVGAARRANGICLESEAQRQALPVRLAYAFTFEIVDGKRNIRSSEVEVR